MRTNCKEENGKAVNVFFLPESVAQSGVGTRCMENCHLKKKRRGGKTHEGENQSTKKHTFKFVLNSLFLQLAI